VEIAVVKIHHFAGGFVIAIGCQAKVRPSKTVLLVGYFTRRRQWMAQSGNNKK